MNTLRKITLFTLAALALAPRCSSDVIQVPPTEKSLQGVWIGLPYQANDFCRLILTNNSGLFAHSFELEKPMLYSVNSYKTDALGNVSFEVSTGSTNAYPILLSGRANSHEIRIAIRSPDGGWSHESVLYREETVNAMLQDLRRSMDQFKGARKDHS